jgi:hypothetical protein
VTLEAPALRSELRQRPLCVTERTLGMGNWSVGAVRAGIRARSRW